MNEEILNEVRRKWSEIGKYKSREDLQTELDFYKKVFDIFQAGDFYYFIFNPALSLIEFVSDSMQQVLGYQKEEFDIQTLLENIHPEDLPRFVDFESTVVDFKQKLPRDKVMKYKSRYNYRLRKKSGEYIRILQQSLTILMDENGAVVRNLVFHTDITDISSGNKMKLSFIGLEGEPSYMDVQPLIKFSKVKEIFTRREKEILGYVIQGFSSERIAEITCCSIHTIRNHRKNILRKSGCQNLNDLLVKATREEWV